MLQDNNVLLLMNERCFEGWIHTWLYVMGFIWSSVPSAGYYTEVYEWR